MKIERQSKILQLINESDIETQEELAKRLFENGLIVTQATISRDIRDLKLTKVTTENGRQKYVVLPDKESNLSEKFIRVFRDGFVSMDRSESIIVIKTLTGMAMAVAAAIDAMSFKDVVGCIAGDDTIFCAVRSEANTVNVMEKLNRISQSNS